MIRKGGDAVVGGSSGPEVLQLLIELRYDCGGAAVDTGVLMIMMT